jgi:hypothetical protein
MSIFGEFDREAVDDEVRGLRKQVADLSAANARLKQPVTDEEWEELNRQAGNEWWRTVLNNFLASRSKEPKAGPCSVCGDSDGKGYCPIHNPEEPKGATE